MRRAALGALVLLALLLPLAGVGQERGTRVPDVPQGDARLVGRVVHAETGEPVRGAEVVLYALPAAAPPGMRRVATRPDGSFAIEGIDASPGTTYLVGAQYAGVSHPGARVVFDPGERERRVDVLVSDVSGARGESRATGLRMRIDWLGPELVVNETLRFENPGTKTVALLRTGPALVEVGLPGGAGPLTGPLGVVPQGLVRTGERVGWFGPLFPGEHEVDYAYSLPARAGAIDLGRTVPEGLAVEILVAAGGPTLEAPALSAGETVGTLGRSYASFSGPARGGALALVLSLPEARHDPDAVATPEVRWIGDLDGAALSVREEHVLLVEGPTPVVADDEPLHHIPLPTGAREVRFAARESGAALAPGSGGLDVRGPLAPGETIVDLSYRLPAGEPLEVERRFGSPLALVSLYLTDNGNLDVSSERLHPRRAVPTSDRSYIHFEAFELGADEALDLRVAAIPPRRRLPARVSLVAMGAGTLAAIWLLVAPLREGEARSDAPEPESAPHRERQALYAALRDLEHDFETGKISAADQERLRRELRARALASLAADPRPEAPAPTVSASLEACRCGNEIAPGDRFCSQCGAAVGGAGA